MAQSKEAPRALGRSGLTASALSLGSATFGREIDEDTSWRILDYALNQGMILLDCAEAYGGGNSRVGRKETYGIDDVREVTSEMYSAEKIIARWMKDRGCRDQVLLLTKVSSGNSAENIRQQVQASLERLMVDQIDIYMLHGPDDGVPLDETLDALNEQLDAGHFKTIGCSNFSAAQLAEALELSQRKGYARFEVVEPSYCMIDRQIEEELLPLCRREQIATITYSPLAAGFLSGKYAPTEERHSFPKGTRFDISPGHADAYFSALNFRILQQLRQKATDLDEPMVYLAMAWVLGRADLTSVLVGARTIDHIDNAIRARDEGISPALRDEMSAWD